MTDKKKEITTEVLLADIMLRETALEQILLDKGIITKEELAAVTEEIAQKVAKVVLEKAKSSKDLNEFISSVETDSEKKNFNN